MHSLLEALLVTEGRGLVDRQELSVALCDFVAIGAETLIRPLTK